jgi:hypothetical protein
MGHYNYYFSDVSDLHRKPLPIVVHFLVVFIINELAISVCILYISGLILLCSVCYCREWKLSYTGHLQMIV